MDFSQWIGLPVLDRKGRRIGYTLAAYANRAHNALSCLKCATDEEEEFYVPARAAALSEGAVSVSGARLAAPSGEPDPVGMAAFDGEGRYLGRVSALYAQRGGGVAIGGKCGIVLPLSRLVFGDAVLVRPRRGRKETPAGQERAERAEPRESLGAGILGKTLKKPLFSGDALIAAAGERVTAEMIARARGGNLLLALVSCTLG